MAIRRTQIPQSQGLVHGAREERVLDRADAQRHYLLSVAWEVSYVFVVVQTEVSDGIVDLGTTVYRGVLGVGEVYQVNPIFLGVNRAHLRTLLAVVDDDLVILRARDECVTIRREVDAVYPIRVLAEYLGHLEAPHHVVD